MDQGEIGSQGYNGSLGEEGPVGEPSPVATHGNISLDRHCHNVLEQCTLTSSLRTCSTPAVLQTGVSGGEGEGRGMSGLVVVVGCCRVAAGLCGACHLTCSSKCILPIYMYVGVWVCDAHTRTCTHTAGKR